MPHTCLFKDMYQYNTVPVIHATTNDFCHFRGSSVFPNDIAPQVVIQNKTLNHIMTNIKNDIKLANEFDNFLIPAMPFSFTSMFAKHFKRAIAEDKGENLTTTQGLYILSGCIYEVILDNNHYFKLIPVVKYWDINYQNQIYVRPLQEMFEVMYRDGYSLPRFCWV